jgi:hypothetical protein
MEHFYNATSMSTNNQVDSQSCKYNESSSFSSVNCDDCFGSINCKTDHCKSVCDLNLCEGSSEDCSEENMTSIVDLYKSLFGKMKQYFSDHDTLGNITINFSQIASSGPDVVRLELWNILKDMYDVGTLNSKSNYVDKQRLDNVLKSQQYIISDDGVLLNNLKTADNTMKRQMEIDLNEFRKTQYNLNVIKQAIVFVAIILIFPALVKLGVLNKNTGLVIWFVLLVVLLIYVVFMIIIKNSNRDDINFREYNFVKPTDDEIARSRIAASMSTKDKAKCKALSAMNDDFDPESINIDITPYKTDEEGSGGQCFSGN